MTPPEERPAPACSRSFDDFFAAMADSRRRYVLYCLREGDSDAASYDDLIDYLLCHDPEATDRAAVESYLHHVGLPKLEAVGLLEHDARSERVRYRSGHRFEDCVDHGRWLETSPAESGSS